MIAIVSLLTVVTLSIVITRVASLALTHTGMSREMARFQARSAFTGVGFTTSEAEKAVNHPLRRRIILLLMLLGNAGFISAVSSLILGFVDGSGGYTTIKVVALVAGLAVLWALASSRWVDRHLSRVVDRLLDRYTRLEVADYASLLRLIGDYRVAELSVEEADWIADKTLEELRLRDEGVQVLGIHRRDDGYVGVPRGDTKIECGDTLILYGRVEALEELDLRERGLAGDREHREAVAEQEEVERRESEERGEEAERGAGGSTDERSRERRRDASDRS